MRIRSLIVGLSAVAMLFVSTLGAAAEWQPSGPITLLIGFRAGGGVDTQARLIAEELTARKGWTIIPRNVPASGGVKAAKELREAPPDGLTIGFVITETMAYNRLASRDPGFGIDDFTYLTTITGSQMTLYAKASRGWKSIDDMLREARGQTLKIGVMSPKLADATYVFGKAQGVEFNIVNLKGGKGVMNAIVADDIDAGFGAGIQGKGVKAGDFVHLLNGETEPLLAAPEVPMFKDYGVPYDLGAKFMMAAPAGIPAEAAAALADTIVEIITDPNTKINKMIVKAFSGPQPLKLDALAAHIRDSSAASERLLQASAN